MGSELVILLVLAAGPGDLPASVASGSTKTSVGRRTVAAPPRMISKSVKTVSRIKPRIARQDLRLVQAAQPIPALSHGETVTTGDVGVSEAVAHEDCACEAGPVPHRHHSLWGIVGLPSPHQSPGNLTQHIPYSAQPKNYYYLRPYNYFHIKEHQTEVMHYGGNAKHPYSNKVFERVYDRVVDPFEEEESEPITPLRLR